MSRIEQGVARPSVLSVEVDGAPLPAYPGETVAAALVAAHHLRIRDDRGESPRGFFCNMGTCSECFVWVAGAEDTGGSRWRRRRACLLPVSPGLKIATREPQATDDD